MGTRGALAFLAVLTVVAWGVPVFEYQYYGTVSLLSVGTAIMLSAMLVAWPFLTGRRMAQGRLEHARMCVECRSFVWPPEQALGFCLRCGSTRKAVPMSA